MRVIVLMIVLLTGCKEFNNFTGGRDQSGAYYPEVCLNSVVYYRVGNNLAIAGKPGGDFHTCEAK